MQTKIMTHGAQKQNEVGFLLPFNRPGETALELKEFFTIGRDEGSSLVLNDPFVSGRHARIEKRAHGFVLRDLGSSNGTFLNDSKITEVTLAQNDRVRFGQTAYVFSDSAAAQSDLHSKNAKWNFQLTKLKAFATTDFPVMIIGPSGSGKEVVAQKIHEFSSRKQAPFISLNCGALSENLIESELFGHTKGSFTGALTDRKGAFESARGGTLFLDEIGDLPLSLQPKLLRAIEAKEIRPLGADRTIATDVRILAATHKDLSLQVMRGEFREDLYFRINVCQINPPPLIERLEDFEDLFFQFAKYYRVRFSHTAILNMKTHSWPGNIRELRNVVSRASAYFPGETITPELLEQLIEKRPERSPFQTEVQANGSRNILKEMEREMILERLKANKGNQRRTALDLGLPKSTLHDRIRAYEINLENY